MKKLFSIFVSCLLTTIAFAIPAKRTTFVATQSDGTKLTLMRMGDEHMHYYLNVDTNEKMLRGKNGDYYVMSEKTYKERKSKGEIRRNEANKARIDRMNARMNATSTAPNGRRKIGSVNSGITGRKKGLIILVNFQDKEMASEHTQTAFDNQFNQVGYSEGGHVGSVHDYFYDQSYGKFDLTFDVVGPVTVSQNMSYYGGNDQYGDDAHPAEMVIEACKLADAQGVNFKDYDWDGDRKVEQVFVIYAGYGEASGGSDDTIWPHEWTLYSAKCYGDGEGAQTFDGVKVDTYACSCELSGGSGSTLNGIGTACHEFSHCLGYPDFYDTSNSGGFGMEGWDLMDYGNYSGPTGNGETPTGYTAYERWVAGWLEPTELTEPNTIEGMKSIGSESEAYILYNDGNKNEYILFENRQSSDKWFQYISRYEAPSGLLAVHVDYDAKAWSNNIPNNVSSHQRMSIIPAGKAFTNKYETTDGYTVDYCGWREYYSQLFGGEYTSLTESSHSDCGGKWFNRNAQSTYSLNHSLTDIIMNGNTIDFLFDGGIVEEEVIPTISSLTDAIDKMLNDNATKEDVDRIVDEILEK